MSSRFDDWVIPAVVFGLVAVVLSNSTNRKFAKTLMLPILNIDNPQEDANVITKYLRAGDIMIFPPQHYPLAAEIQASIPGLAIGTGGTSISNLLSGMYKLPPNVEYVTYDYEPGHTPEYTSDPDIAMGYFSQLQDEAHLHGHKSVIVPVYYYGRHWDWGAVGQTTDVLVLQVQNYQKNSRLTQPDQGNFTVAEIARIVSEQLRPQSNAKFFIQLDTLVSDNPDEIAADVLAAEPYIDGVTLWHNPSTQDATSRLELLNKVLQRLV